MSIYSNPILLYNALDTQMTKQISEQLDAENLHGHFLEKDVWPNRVGIDTTANSQCPQIEWIRDWMTQGYQPNLFDLSLRDRMTNKATRCTRAVFMALGIDLPANPQLPAFGPGILTGISEKYDLRPFKQAGGLAIDRLTATYGQHNWLVFTKGHVYVKFACGIAVDTTHLEKRKPTTKIEFLWEFRRKI